MITAPSLSDLNSAISSNFKSQFGITSTGDLKRVLSVIAASDAGMLKLFYLALLDVQKNILPDLADYEANGGTLERYGRLKLGRDPNPATQGRYTVSITGVNGTILPSGTQFVNKVTNTYYNSTSSVTIVGGVSTVPITSTLSGSDLMQVGDTIFTVNTIVNITSSASIASIVSVPTDAEDLEVYRGLILESYRLEPNGGSAADYVKWAMDVNGIRTVYPYTTVNGQANIYAEGNAADLGVVDSSTLELLWKNNKTGVFEFDPSDDVINSKGRRPLGFIGLNILSVTPVPVIVTIVGLKDDSDHSIEAIIMAMTTLLYGKRPYIAGVGDINNRQDTLYFKDVVSALDLILDSSNTYDSIDISSNGFELPCTFGLYGDACIIPTLDKVTVNGTDYTAPF